MRPTFHLCATSELGPLAAGRAHHAGSLEDEGFIHCTDGEMEVLATGNRHYRADPRTFAVLTVDLDRVGVPWRIDDPDGIYPHIYGPIAADSVVAVRTISRRADGTFDSIDQPRSIGADELIASLHDERTMVIDVRPIHGYNGWRLDDEHRGGHIPGALAFPVDWLEQLDDEAVRHVLDTKGVRMDRTVIVVGRGTVDTAIFAAVLEANAIHDVQQLDGGAPGWAVDPTRPLESLPRYQTLVHADWLGHVLAGDRVEAAPAGRVTIVHVTYRAPEDYTGGHIPGALHLDIDWLDDPVSLDHRPLEQLWTVIDRLGITADTTVVIYGRDDPIPGVDPATGRGAGRMAAARAMLILTYAGIEDVRLLDGGLEAWLRSGGRTETLDRSPGPSTVARKPATPRTEVFADIDGAKEILADEGAVLVSVRSWAEQVGATSGYDYIEAVGRIAGDVWGNGGSDAYQMQPYRNVDGTMRPYPEIAAMWAAAGITRDRRVAFYCGTGWRAAEAWLAAHLQAWPRVTVYDGGWFEWCKDPEHNPITIGEPGP